MSTKEKLRDRILSIPADLKYSEMQSFFISLGYRESNKGSSSGSRVAFISDTEKITFHKPHGSKPMGRTTIRQIIEALRSYGKLWHHVLTLES